MNTERETGTPLNEKLATESSEAVSTVEEPSRAEVVDMRDVVEKALEVGKYQGANFEVLDAEGAAAVLESRLAGTPAKEIVRIFKKTEAASQNQLRGIDQRLLSIEQIFIEKAVEETASVMELIDLTRDNVAFYGREPLTIHEKKYTYAQALKDVAGGVMALEDLPNDFGIREKLHTLGVVGLQVN
jgi:hypothetical protein